MKMWIVMVFTLLALVSAGYCQDQGKDELLDAAIKEFQQAIEKNPGCAEAHYNLGVVYREKAMTEEAITAYKNRRD